MRICFQSLPSISFKAQVFASAPFPGDPYGTRSGRGLEERHGEECWAAVEFHGWARLLAQKVFRRGVRPPWLDWSETKPCTVCRARELFPLHVLSTMVMISLLEACFVGGVSTQQAVQSFTWKKSPVLLGWAKCLFRAACPPYGRSSECLGKYWSTSPTRTS